MASSSSAPADSSADIRELRLDGRFRYGPASGELERRVGELSHAYNERPVTLITASGALFFTGLPATATVILTAALLTYTRFGADRLGHFPGASRFVIRGTFTIVCSVKTRVVSASSSRPSSLPSSWPRRY